MNLKKILISQQQPKTVSPYDSISDKFGVEFDFKPFFKMEPLSSREFRSQRINILEHSAVIFSARTTIDAFFLFFEELRDSILNLIGSKHKGESFLIATSESSSKDAVSRLFEQEGLNFETAVFVKPVSQDLKDVNLKDYDMIVLFNPADVKSLFENHPDFEQGKTLFVSYGRSVVRAMEEAGLKIEISAPNPEAPSVAKALEIYLSKQN